MPELATQQSIEAGSYEERLAAAEAAEFGASEVPAEAVEVDAAAQQPAPGAESGTETTPKTLSSDTPAAAAAPKPGEPAAAPQKKDETQGNQAKPEPSKYQKSIERGFTNWKEFKEWETKTRSELDSKSKTHEQKERDLQLQVQKFEQQRAKTNAKVNPDQCDAWAATQLKEVENCELKAKGLEAEAEKLETDGNFKGAQAKREEAKGLNRRAAYLEGKAKEATDMAAHLRKNPDPTSQQIEAKQARELQHYTVEAAKQWPDLGVKGSEFQKQMVVHEQALQKQGFSVKEMPILRYHVARLVAAETAAARVPAMNKELGDLRAKVKELELLTSPGGGDSAVARQASDAPLTDDQEEAELRAEAARRGR